jgi:uncharacterized membrane protein YhhN
MLALSLTVCIGLSALVALRADYAAARVWFYVFKPLTTVLIIVLALALPAASGLYRAGIVVGLLLSLAGDVLLMLPEAYFVHGLVSFLLAHLCYLATFTARSGLREPAWLALPFALAVAGLIWQIAPRAGKLRWPVAIYGLALLGMAWRACALWMVTGNWPAALGGGLFVISDVTLAVNRFVRRFWAAQLVVLGTYYAALCLLAWSVTR